jgi:hypothetical protein
MDADLRLSWFELFFFPDSVFLQATIPYQLQLRDAMARVTNKETRKLLLHRFIQEANGDQMILSDILQ